MICLLNKDEDERAASIEAVAHHCASVGAKLVLVADGVTGSQIEQRLLDAGGASIRAHIERVTFDIDSQVTEEMLVDVLQSLRAKLLAFVEYPRKTIVWIECPLDPTALSARLGNGVYEQRLDQALETLGVVRVSGHLLPGSFQPLLASVLPRKNLAVFGSVLTRYGCSWLFERRAIEPDEGVERLATMPPPANLAQYVYSENLSEMGLMAAGIAHELANPLALISSSLQYLHERLIAANDSTSEFTMAALLNVERMHGLLQSMLNLAGAKGLTLREVDLNALVFEALRFVSDECRQRGVEVEASLNAPSLVGRFDSARVMQIILNLLLNAIEAVPANDRRLRVSTQIATGSEQAIIAIENSGNPIPEDVRRNMFRPFFTTKANGTGLGLYLSRQNARAHGGNIYVENLDNRVRFTVTLPLRS